MGAYSRTGGRTRTVARTASRTNDEERGARRSTAARSPALASSAKDPLGPSLPSVSPSRPRSSTSSFPPSRPLSALTLSPKRRFLHSPAEQRGEEAIDVAAAAYFVRSITDALAFILLRVPLPAPARLEDDTGDRAHPQSVVHFRPQVSSVASAGGRRPCPHCPCMRSSFRSRMRQIPNGRNDTWRENGEANRC